MNKSMLLLHYLFSLKRFAMHLGSSLPTNLLPTRDTNNSKHLFDYKTTAGLEEAVDEDDEMDGIYTHSL